VGPSSSLSHDRRRGRAWPRLLSWPANPLRHSSPNAQVHHTTGAAASPVRASTRASEEGENRRRPRRRRRASEEKEEEKKAARRERLFAPLRVSVLLESGAPPLAPPIAPPRSRLHPPSRRSVSTPGRRRTILHREIVHTRKAGKKGGKTRAPPQVLLLHVPYARVLGPFPTRKGS